MSDDKGFVITDRGPALVTMAVLFDIAENDIRNDSRIIIGVRNVSDTADINGDFHSYITYKGDGLDGELACYDDSGCLERLVLTHDNCDELSDSICSILAFMGLVGSSE